MGRWGEYTDIYFLALCAERAYNIPVAMNTPRTQILVSNHHSPTEGAGLPAEAADSTAKRENSK